jgi:hypothetical protein
MQAPPVESIRARCLYVCPQNFPKKPLDLRRRSGMLEALLAGANFGAAFADPELNRSIRMQE